MISVVIVTYNRFLLLKQSLNHILNQSFESIEIIIIDDGSEDETLSMVKSFCDDRIKYFNFGKIGNLSKLRNIGIRLASNNFIAFCDDDDLWIDKDKLIKQFNYMENYKLVCTNSYIIDIDNKVIKQKYFPEFKKSFMVDTNFLLSNGNCVLTPSVLFDKRILENSNTYYDEVKFNKYCEDFEFLIRLSKHTNFYFINENMVSVRFHKSVSGGIDNNIKMLNSSIEILHQYRDYIENNNEISKRATEGTLGYMILLIKLNFKKNLHSGIKEIFKFIFFIGNPKVFYIFVNTKLKRAILKYFKKVFNIKK